MGAIENPPGPGVRAVLWRFRVPQDIQSGRGLRALQDAGATASGCAHLRPSSVTIYVPYVKEQEKPNSHSQNQHSPLGKFFILD
jgi:hypothetical protein